MHIAVDVRHLTNPHPTGVGLYTLHILRAMLHAPEHTWSLFSTGTLQRKLVAQSHLEGMIDGEHVRHIHQLVPNRWLNASVLLTHRPAFDPLLQSAPDVWFLPNINFFPATHTPVVLTLHDLSFVLLPQTYTKKYRLWHRLVRPGHLATHATALVVPSQATGHDVAHTYGVHPQRIHVVTHGVSPSFTPEKTPQDHGVRSRYNLPRTYLLHPGSGVRKNTRAVIDAYEEAWRTSEVLRRHDVHLVLFGRNDSQTSTRVHALGYVAEGDKPALYRYASATVYPSLYEGFGLPILESFASGTPVITSTVPALLEVGGTGVLSVNPFNPRDIAEAIKLVIEDEVSRQMLVREGFNRVESFSWERAGKETLRVLEHATHTDRSL